MKLRFFWTMLCSAGRRQKCNEEKFWVLMSDEKNEDCSIRERITSRSEDEASKGVGEGWFGGRRVVGTRPA